MAPNLFCLKNTERNTATKINKLNPETTYGCLDSFVFLPTSYYVLISAKFFSKTVTSVFDRHFELQITTAGQQCTLEGSDRTQSCSRNTLLMHIQSRNSFITNRCSSASWLTQQGMKMSQVFTDVPQGILWFS